MNAFVKVGLGIAGGIAACWALKKSGMDKKVVSAVNTVGTKTTAVATTVVSSTVDIGAKAGDLVETGVRQTVNVAESGVEAASYGLGVATRAVVDLGSKAGSATSNNPVSRGFAAGFYRPETKACGSQLATC